jgi:hypothetical protein
VEFRRRLARFGEELSALKHDYDQQQAANQAAL